MTNIAILLAILCSTLTCFIISVVAWAINNARDMCKKAPQLSISFNYLPATSLAIAPALAIGAVAFWLAYRVFGIKRRLWSMDLVIDLNMIQLALVTVYFMPDRLLEGTWDGHVDCAAF